MGNMPDTPVRRDFRTEALLVSSYRMLPDFHSLPGRQDYFGLLVDSADPAQVSDFSK